MRLDGHPSWAAFLLIVGIVACAARSGFSPSTSAEPPPSASSVPSRAAVSASSALPAAPPGPGFVGSAACAPCHGAIYERWKRTPMANVVRDPRTGPGVILPDLATNTVSPFAREDVALVYGSRWKQRYVTHRVWRRYFVENGTDWWAALYPPDNMKRPTGPLCDGCHSVGYDVHTKQVAEWNVGCERCHGDGAAHVALPTAANIVNPARMEDRLGDDTCIQCHSQGRPLVDP